MKRRLEKLEIEIELRKLEKEKKKLGNTEEEKDNTSEAQSEDFDQFYCDYGDDDSFEWDEEIPDWYPNDWTEWFLYGPLTGYLIMFIEYCCSVSPVAFFVGTILFHVKYYPNLPGYYDEL